MIKHKLFKKNNTIKYKGLKNKGKVYYIVFSNELNNIVEIPIAKEEHDRIAIYLDKISTFNRKVITRENDEPID